MTEKALSATRIFEEVSQPFSDFYRFQKLPFDRAIPTEHLFMTDRHEEILARMTYAIERQWLWSDGACGSGKSTFRRLMRTLDPFRYRASTG